MLYLQCRPKDDTASIARRAMPRATIASYVLDFLAQERRIIASDWRFHITYMRVARSQGYALPDTTKLNQLIKTLLAARDIAPIAGVSGVYRITVPYASVLPSPQEVIIQEANPTAVFSHFTAAAHNDLTNEMPNAVHLTYLRTGCNRLPVGTTPEDWNDIPEPRRRMPEAIDGTPIQWSQIKPEWDFGYIVGYVQGYAIYVTDLERTLLDGLRFPDRNGGPMEALRMWKRAAPRLRLNVLIDYTKRFNQTLLRQRVGFLLEHMRLTHPILQDWAKSSVRGSSAKLIANLDFCPVYSERWNLSINVPDTILSELKDD
jgi:predicted transcriptional regulator of viral defense system